MNKRRSPLYAEHVRLGAKLVSFGGWEMPLEYQGTIAEHLACRSAAAMFDVSHLGTVRISGPSAFETLQATLSNDLDKIEAGRAQYTHLLDHDGSVLDDIIVWWHPRAPDADDVFDVMPNASNTERVVAAIGGTDVTATRAVIAVQGPSARELVATVVPETGDLRRFRVAEVPWRNTTLVAAGTGYTGEAGLEIAVPASAARELWREIESAGATPAGLGARDTLRLEAGFPLYGHELGPDTNPLATPYAWVVKDKPFYGREAMWSHDAGRRLVGLRLAGRGIARQGYEVTDADGAPLGEVTSGTLSPLTREAIAMAWVRTAHAEPGSEVSVLIRGQAVAATVVVPPFFGS